MTRPSCAQDTVHGAVVVRTDASHFSSAGPALFEPGNPDLAAIPVSHGGRQAAWFIDGEFGPAVLRHYRRGGLVARVLRDRYLWTGPEATRSFAEFNLLATMTDLGLPVPRPLGACYRRRGLFYTAAILIERIPAVEPLARVLAHGNHMAVARAIADMHHAGVWHADLNAYNILLNRQGAVWLIDFDKSRLMEITPQHRHANLLRLRRSLTKVAGADGARWWQVFNQAYIGLTSN